MILLSRAFRLPRSRAAARADRRFNWQSRVAALLTRRSASTTRIVIFWRVDEPAERGEQNACKKHKVRLIVIIFFASL